MKSRDIPEILTWFREEYLDKAGLVTGHYIRKFDLPILNMSCMEWGLPPLKPVLVHDTKTELINFEGMSKSQENLGLTLRVERKKYHMADADWRRSTRMTEGGQQRSRDRAEHDVEQHQQIYRKMMDRGWLKPPRMWSP